MNWERILGASMEPGGINCAIPTMLTMSSQARASREFADLCAELGGDKRVHSGCWL